MYAVLKETDDIPKALLDSNLKNVYLNVLFLSLVARDVGFHELGLQTLVSIVEVCD